MFRSIHDHKAPTPTPSSPSLWTNFKRQRTRVNVRGFSDTCRLVCQTRCATRCVLPSILWLVVAVFCNRKKHVLKPSDHTSRITTTKLFIGIGMLSRGSSMDTRIMQVILVPEFMIGSLTVFSSLNLGLIPSGLCQLLEPYRRDGHEFWFNRTFLDTNKCTRFFIMSDYWA